jgi:hypothetical protein
MIGQSNLKALKLKGSKLKKTSESTENHKSTILSNLKKSECIQINKIKLYE